LEHAVWTVRLHPALPFQSDRVGFEIPGLPGIEFFFVLSGFVMMMVHGEDFGHADRILPFLWRRCCRIFPLYWLVLAAMVWQFWSTLPGTAVERIGWVTLWPLTIQNLLPVAWTLRQEMLFYLMLALCMLPRIGLWILGLWVGSHVAATLGLLPWPTERHPVLILLGLNYDFFLGLLTGFLYRRLAVSHRLCLALLGFGTAGILVGLWATKGGTELGPSPLRCLAGLSFGAVIFACGRLEEAGWLRPGRWAVWCGIASYPLYLSHVMVYDYLVRPIGSTGLAAAIGPNPTLILLAALAVPVGLLLGLADRHVQRLLRRRSRASAREPVMPY
jgi:peptidoglycan/LPS O-acetylase OafA/YrhL